MARSDPLERLRRICLALPEATEQRFGGHTTPTFRVRDKIFVMYADDNNGRGKPAIWCKAPPGAQQVLVGSDPQRFFAPPYVGKNGWIGVRLHAPVDWAHVGDLVTDSYCMTAPKRLASQLADRA
jgi:predicted DNA-binding protein (MmcQ/YjbR family)